MSGPHFGWSQCNTELANKLSTSRPSTDTAPTFSSQPSQSSRPTESSLPPLPTAAAAPREIPSVLMFQRSSAGQPVLNSSPVRASQPVLQIVEPLHRKPPQQKSSPEIHNMLSPLLDFPPSVVVEKRTPQVLPQSHNDLQIPCHPKPTFAAEPWYPTAAAATPHTVLSHPLPTFPNTIRPDSSNTQATPHTILPHPIPTFPNTIRSDSSNTQANVFGHLQGGTGQAALALLPKTGPIVILMAVAAIVSVGWSVLSPRQRKIAGTVIGLVTTLLFFYGGPLLSYLPLPQTSSAARSRETAGDRYKNMPYRQPVGGPQQGGPTGIPASGNNSVRPNMAVTPTVPPIHGGHTNHGNVSPFPQIPNRQPSQSQMVQPPRPPQPNTHPQPVPTNVVIQSPVGDPLRPGYNSSVNRIVPSEISHFAAANLMGGTTEEVVKRPEISVPTAVPAATSVPVAEIAGPMAVAEPVVSLPQNNEALSYGYSSSPLPPSTPPSVTSPSPSYSSSATSSVPQSPPSPQYQPMPWYQTSAPGGNGMGTPSAAAGPGGSIMAVSPDSYRGTSSAPVGVHGVSGHGYNGMVPGQPQRPQREEWNDIPPYREAMSPYPNNNNGNGSQPYYPVPPIPPAQPSPQPQPQGLRNFYIR